MKRIFLIIILFTFFSFCAIFKSYAQIPSLLNFDKKKYHFGILIGFNQMLFNVKEVENSTYADTLYGINSFFAPGFHLGVLADLRLSEYVNLRLLPGLSFNERRIEYYFKTDDPESLTETYFKSAESVFADIPLELKLRSKRWFNFRPYVIAGIRYTFDLASLRKVKNLDEREKVVKVNPNDLLYTVGVGFDFYLKYFKFAIEIKMSFGTNNLLIDENSIYTNKIQSITSRVFNFTLTFE